MSSPNFRISNVQIIKSSEKSWRWKCKRRSDKLLWPGRTGCYRSHAFDLFTRELNLAFKLEISCFRSSAKQSALTTYVVWHTIEMTSKWSSGSVANYRKLARLVQEPWNFQIDNFKLPNCAEKGVTTIKFVSAIAGFIDHTLLTKQKEAHQYNNSSAPIYPSWFCSARPSDGVWQLDNIEILERFEEKVSLLQIIFGLFYLILLQSGDENQF